jgi:hypothetical protein
MKSISYNAILKDNRMADALMDRSIFIYKARVNDLRLVQSTILNLAKILSELPDYACVVIIDGTKISKSRLWDEWQSLYKLLQPSILNRLRMVVFTRDSIIEKFGDLTNDEIVALVEIREELSKSSFKNLNHRKDALFEILRILLIHWFRRSGSLQLTRLEHISGYSYPTVAAALNKLDDNLIRHSDRSVELKSFPQRNWLKLITTSDEKRAVSGYWAYRPKSMEYLIKRVQERHEKDIAFGGVIGARYYLPGIDLTGIHRLDLTVLKWDSSGIETMIRELDPGLKKIERGTLPQVLVHNLTRAESLFNQGETFNIADEVECLLDLHEARLESPFSELLEHFKEQVNQ